MKNVLYLFVVILLAFACNTSKPSSPSTSQKLSDEKIEALKTNDTVVIENEKLEYEIIIIEPGFNYWVNAIARPRGYYSQGFLENRNRLMVMEWNQRVLQPQLFNRNLYELQIDYQPTIDYGYEVNYLLYNYFIYFQLTYNQRLGPFVPRI
ncbi:DUF6146 family protein [Cognatitamlana onchidii]|uniref:DUF6146 family protein n=1 Tax=Cognatitamlana onchidii TaxID=2562860 RepID=UPI0010A6B341|nr:DUF6146 family protein [Algibacter onchidii]